jgi:hypothetical protein
MKTAVWVFVVMLLVLHQDDWLWDNPKLIGDWAPITLVYHAGISAASAIVWYLATLYCWPKADVDPDKYTPPQDKHA